LFEKSYRSSNRPTFLFAEIPAFLFAEIPAFVIAKIPALLFADYNGVLSIQKTLKKYLLKIKKTIYYLFLLTLNLLITKILKIFIRLYKMKNLNI